MQTDRPLEAFDNDDPDDAASDFASEHEDTAVDPAIPDDRDEGETESPTGWDGMDGEGPP